MCVSVCVQERKRFGLQDHFVIFFIFKKFKPQKKKKLIFKEHLYQRQIAVFQSPATCLSFCPLREGVLAQLRAGGSWVGWR